MTFSRQMSPTIRQNNIERVICFVRAPIPDTGYTYLLARETRNSGRRGVPHTTKISREGFWADRAHLECLTCGRTRRKRRGECGGGEGGHKYNSVVTLSPNKGRACNGFFVYRRWIAKPVVIHHHSPPRFAKDFWPELGSCHLHRRRCPGRILSVIFFHVRRSIFEL